MARRRMGGRGGRKGRRVVGYRMVFARSVEGRSDAFRADRVEVPMLPETLVQGLLPGRLGDQEAGAPLVQNRASD